MNKEEIKRELARLIAETSQIAPSIAKYEQNRSYGSVTDELLNFQASQRWELEAAVLLSKLASSQVEVFVRLQAEYVQIKENSKKFHSRSILIHQVMQLLTSANELLDSAITSVKATSEKSESKKDLELPQKITLPWLFKHVPVNIWLAACGLIIATFIAGIKSSDIRLIREFFLTSKIISTSNGNAETMPAKP